MSMNPHMLSDRTFAIPSLKPAPWYLKDLSFYMFFQQIQLFIEHYRGTH
jgi:hypothetical protein